MTHRSPGDMIESLRRIPLFAPFSDADLEQLAFHIDERAVPQGQFLTHEGLPVEGMYIVISGRFKRFKTLYQREQILKIMGPGDTFREVPVLDGGLSPASTQALEDGAVYVLMGTELERMIRSSPEFALLVIRSLAGRLRHMTELTGDLSLRRTVERVARLILSREVAGDLHRLTQSDMASLAGTAREVVGRALGHLTQRGAIEVEHGRITIQDRMLLQSIADGTVREQSQR